MATLLGCGAAGGSCAQHSPDMLGSHPAPWTTLPPLRTYSEQPNDEAAEQVLLSPLSQFFCNVEQSPDIYATMQLAGRCSLEELVAPMQAMADLHDRFRRRLVLRNGAWAGEVLQGFDVRSLMRSVTLPGPDAQAAFDAFMGELMTSHPLGAHGLPPWDVLVISYSCDPHRTDVLMRASHIIGDGQLFMKLIKQIMVPLDAAAEADYAALLAAEQAAQQAEQQQGGSRRQRLLRRGGSGCSTPSLSSAVASSGCSGRNGEFSSGDSDSGISLSDDSSSIGTAPDAEPEQQQQQQQRPHRRPAAAQQVQAQQQQRSRLSHQPCAGDERPVPHQQQQQQQQQQRRWQQRSPWRQIGGAFRAVWRLLVSLWRGYTALLFTAAQPFGPSDPVTLLKAAPDECGGARVWSSVTLSLREFHRTARALRVSVNTLAVSCLAGGVRRYLLAHGVAPATRLRLCSMVDTRSMPGLLTGTSGNSNNFSFIGVPLFTGQAGPLARLARVAGALSWIRHSLAVPLATRIPIIIHFLFRDPRLSSWAMVRCMPSKTTIGFSNMRGPAGSWALGGYRVARIHNGVQPSAWGSFISLFSYGGSLTFTHTAYTSKTRQPQLLLACLVEEYQLLRKEAALSGDASQLCSISSDGGAPGSERIKAA